MAYARKVKNGWRIEVARNGVRESRTFETKAAATLWAASRESEILAVKRGGIPRKTFAEALERYRDTISIGKKGGPFEAKRIGALLRDYPQLVQREFGAINGADLAQWRDARLKIVTKGSVQRDINLLSNVFTIARTEWKWCKDSPLQHGACGCVSTVLWINNWHLKLLTRTFRAHLAKPRPT